MLQPTDPVPLTQPEPRIVCVESDGGQKEYSVTVDGRQMTAFGTLLECVDLAYKMFFVFRLKYTRRAEFIFKFIEHAVCEQKDTKKVPNTVRELAKLLKKFEAE